VPERPHLWQLFSGPGYAWCEHRCGHAPRGFGSEEAASGHELAFVRSGAFVRRVAGVERWADATRVHFFRRDEPYRIAHPLGGGDRCTLLALEAELFDEVLDAAGGGLADARRAPAHDAVIDGALYARQVRLERAARISGDALELAEHVLALVREAARALLGPMAVLERSPRARARARRLELVRAARELATERLDEPLALEDLARTLGCSPFHLARTFARESGVPLHRYRNRLRLARALERVVAGERDLAALALASGFASHSHFDDAFRREFGCSPSALRPRTARRALADARVRKNPEA
jgi:AraC-like DNA-binding protein